MSKGREIYFKQGDEYVKMGCEFMGFPSNGLWLVKDGSQSQICKLSDLESLDDPLPYATLMKYEKYALDAVLKLYNDNSSCSLSQLTSLIIRTICEQVCKETNTDRQRDNIIKELNDDTH